MRPKRPRAASTSFCTDPMSLTSVRTPSARSAAPSFSAAATGSAMSATTTRAPSATKRVAYAKPIPAAPPVMMATLLDRRIRLDSIRGDDGFHATAGGGVGKGVLDLLQGEPGGHERLDAEPRHDREGAAEGASAPERPM